MLIGLCAVAFASVAVYSYLSNPVVAIVGDYKITQRDVKYKNLASLVNNPQEMRNLGLEQLIRGYTYAQILKNNEAAITNEVLDKEVERINTHSSDPEMLAKIKNVFGFDTKRFRRVFVLPSYAERAVYSELFLKSPKLREEASKSAENFLQVVRNSPQKINQSAPGKSEKLLSYQVSYKDGLREMNDSKKIEKANPGRRGIAARPLPHLAPKLRPKLDEQRANEAKHWIQDILTTIKPGEIYPKLVEHNQQWLVVQYLGATQDKENTYQFKAAVFSRTDYSSWLDAEIKKVTIQRL